MRKRAFITGITGQDGSYLAEFLLAKGYEVHGLTHSQRLENIAAIKDRLLLHSGDLANHEGLRTLIQAVHPDECYHFAGSSYYQYSASEEAIVLNNNFVSTQVLLASLLQHSPNCRFFFAGSSEVFGEATTSPQDENTPFLPTTYYAVAKAKSSELIRDYRERHSFFGCTGIFFNHESPRRGLQFVTRKITSTVARIKLGLESRLTLGNLETTRDWGYAPDYVRAAWMMLQADQPDDFVIATGLSHTVRQFVEYAFSSVDLDYRNHVEFDPKFYRETEKVPRLGNSSKIRNALGWAPSVSLKSMIDEMVQCDLRLAERASVQHI